jgi:colanic acid/amylovoran biosynthesis glycosyltransferase
MRIAYLLARYPALSHTFIFREVAELRKHGFDIRLCSINESDRLISVMPPDEGMEVRRTYYIKRAGIPAILGGNAAEFLRSPFHFLWMLVVVLRAADLDLRQMARMLFYFAEAVMVGRWMRSRDCSHLHVHFGSQVATVAWIVHKLFPVTYSMTIHGPDEFYQAGRMMLSQKVAGAKFVFCISEFARSQLMLLSEPAHWPKLIIAPLGVDPEDFQRAAEPPEDTAFRILCVARYAPAKGIDILMQAAARLRQQGHNLVVRIVGDGPDRRRLASLCKTLGNPCDLLGPAPRTVVPDLLASSDAFVLPSFAEGVPVSLMEAMAAGVPCVSTRIAGIPELIRDEVDGILVPPGNVDELAAAILRLMKEPGLRTRLAETARRRVEQKYNLTRNVDHLARQFELHLKDTLHAPRRSSRPFGHHRVVPHTRPR